MFIFAVVADAAVVPENSNNSLVLLFPGSAMHSVQKNNPLLRTFFLSFLSCHSNTSLQTKSDLLKIE